MSYCESIVEQENVYMEEVWKEKKCKKNEKKENTIKRVFKPVLGH